MFSRWRTRSKAGQKSSAGASSSDRNWRLPPRKYRMGGEHFRDDDAFVASAVRDVQRLQDLAGLTVQTRLMDWGCGAGRLAVGVREHLGRIQDYHGVDVQPELIEWAQRHLSAPGFRFTCVDVSNERYNPDGSPARTIATDAASIDLLYAYSVFSHMNDVDTPAYLTLIAEALVPGGRAFFTCFVEEGVPDWEENPAGYGPLDWKGRLHCTRFAREHFEEHVNASGLRVELFEYGQETDGQSLYVVQRPSSI